MPVMGSLSPTHLAIFGAIGLYLLSILRWRARTGGRPLPPGPKRLPIVGNMFNMPRSRQWLGYRDLSRELGERRRSWLKAQKSIVDPAR